MNLIARILGSIWALPVTIFGLIFALSGGFGSGINYTGGVLLVAGPFPKWTPLGLFFNHWPLFKPAAVTIGEVVIFAGKEVPQSTFWHELRHVTQCRRLGIFQPIFYLLFSLVALIMGEHTYRANWFEIDANNHE